MYCVIFNINSHVDVRLMHYHVSCLCTETPMNILYVLFTWTLMTHTNISLYDHHTTCNPNQRYIVQIIQQHILKQWHHDTSYLNSDTNVDIGFRNIHYYYSSSREIAFIGIHNIQIILRYLRNNSLKLTINTSRMMNPWLCISRDYLCILSNLWNIHMNLYNPLDIHVFVSESRDILGLCGIHDICKPGNALIYSRDRDWNTIISRFESLFRGIFPGCNLLVYQWRHNDLLTS
jgi:hypothetical protein